eukprot:3555443-Pleurochrysis_carterae.AAC.1
MHTNSIKKTVLRKVTLASDEKMSSHDADRQYIVRIQLSKEFPLIHVPIWVARTEHMRIVKRTSAVAGDWSYDFSEVWSAKTRFACEKLIKENVDPSYE